MRTREDFIKRLREDDLYRQALSHAKDDNERRTITSMVEGFVGELADVLTPVMARVESDPIFAERLARSIVEGEPVFTDEPVSGSTT